MVINPKETKHTLVENFLAQLYSQNEFPLHVEVHASRFTKVVSKSGNDILPELLKHMDPVRYNNIIELGIGTNAGATAENINWSYNSPINESALGFHFALGDGAMSPHIDFICSSPDAYDSFFVK